MNGRVDAAGRALVRVRVIPAADGRAEELEAWIDTGFTGELVLPRDVVNSLGLKQSGTVTAELGDGSSVVLDIYTCFVDWFDHERTIEVVSNAGSLPLLGVGLLQDRKLVVDYASKSVTIE